MNNRKTLFSDLHLFGVDPSEVFIEYGPNVIFLGDNFEFKNIPKDSVQIARKSYLRFLERARSTLSIVIDGNHEVSERRSRDYYFENGVMYTHGHYIFYSVKQILKWINRLPGRSFFGRLFSKALSKTRNIVPKNKLSKKQVRKMVKYHQKMQEALGEQIHTIVCGHVHPSKTIDVNINGVRYIVVPRGRTEIWV